MQGDVWQKISGEAKDLLCSMIVVDPLQRIKISEVLKHPWFTSDPKRAIPKQKLVPVMKKL